MMTDYKLYESANGKVYKMPPNHCVFCEHCTDILYDYTNGPYCFFCDLDDETTSHEYKTCGHFEDSGYEFDEKEYLERMDKQRIANEQMRDFLKAHPEIADEIHKSIERYLLYGVKG